MSDEKVKVEFGADTGNLQQGTEAAAGAVNGFVAEAKAAFASVAATTEASMAHVSAAVREGAIQAKESMEGISSTIKGVQGAFMLFGEVMMAGFIGERILEMAKGFSEAGDNLEKLSQKTGMSTDALQELQYAAYMGNVSTEAFDKGIKKLAMNMTLAQQGSLQAVAAFQEVGISASDLSHMRLEDVLRRVADKYESTADGANKMANAQQLLGRSGGDLIPVLDGGSAAMDAYATHAREMGYVMSEADIASASKLDGELKSLHISMQVAGRTIGLALVPTLGRLAQAISDSMTNGGAFKSIVDGLAWSLREVMVIANGVVAVFQAVGTTIGGVAAAAVELMHGRFAGAKAIMVALAGDLAKLNDEANKFSAKIKGTEKPEGTGEEKNPKPKADLIPVMTTGQTSEIDAWKQELEAKKDAEGDYFKNSLDMELAFWGEKRALTKEGSKERRAVDHEIYALHKTQAQQGLAEDIAYLKYQQEIARKGGDERLAIEDQIGAVISAAYGEDSKEYKAALREKEKVHRQYEQEQIKLIEARIDKEKQLSLISVSMDEENIKFRKTMGQISAVEEVNLTKETEEKKYNIERDTLESKLALQQEDLAAQEKTLGEIEALEKNHGLKLQQLSNQKTLAIKSDWDNVFSAVTSAFETSIQGMIMGTTTLKKAMQNLAQSILAEFVNLGVKQVFAMISTQLALTNATAAGAASRLAIESWAAIKSAAIWVGTALKDIAIKAYEAAAGAYNAVVGIPYVGPILAPIAAGTAFAAVSGFGASVASAAGGWEVPADQMALVHKNEMVLPASLSDRIRDMTEPAQQVSPTVNVNIHTMDSRDVKRFFNKHGGDIADSLKGEYRNYKR